MKEELRNILKTIFTQLIDTSYSDVEWIDNSLKSDCPKVGGNIFDFEIHYDHKRRGVFFVCSDSEGLVQKEYCQKWIDAIRTIAEKNHRFSICIITDKGFAPDAVEMVNYYSFDINHAIILAKYTGSREHVFVLNRQWRDYMDPRSRTGVLMDMAACEGAMFYKRNEVYNAVGILSELGIPICDKYIFKCPYMDNEDIELRANEVCEKYGLSFQDIDDEIFLDKILDGEGLNIRMIDMGAEFFGEYVHNNNLILLNTRYHSEDEITRERFTVAHELGHHFLHR